MPVAHPELLPDQRLHLLESTNGTHGGSSSSPLHSLSARRNQRRRAGLTLDWSREIRARLSTTHDLEVIMTLSSTLALVSILVFSVATAHAADPSPEGVPGKESVRVGEDVARRNHDRARSAAGPDQRQELPRLRRRQVLRRHDLPPRHSGFHDPGRRLHAQHAAEGDQGADQERGRERLEEPAPERSRWRAPASSTARRRSSSSTSPTTPS